MPKFGTQTFPTPLSFSDSMDAINRAVADMSALDASFSCILPHLTAPMPDLARLTDTVINVAPEDAERLNESLVLMNRMCMEVYSAMYQRLAELDAVQRRLQIAVELTSLSSRASPCLPSPPAEDDDDDDNKDEDA